MIQEGPINISNLKDSMQQWLKDHNISGYYSFVQSSSLSIGAKMCMSIAGLGKLSPNLVLLGFKNNWRQDLDGLKDYIDIMYNAFDLKLSFVILRTREGFNLSSVIASEQQFIREVPVEKNDEDVKTVDKIVQFRQKKRTGTIDVWWLYDDGGLTLLLPHIIKTRKQFKNCKLRVFSLANKSTQLDIETRNLASMLSKFRIDYETVTALPDVTKKAEAATKAEFDAMIDGCNIPETELQEEREKTNR